ncbi:MAG TPA: GyrI-like domain-containing protein [Flavobacteriaceae bacterium]|nr:GyrI-like domain-containing protein [Flavobacteriaceae bacterium]
MLQSKWFKIALLFAFIIGCIWYFIIKDYNYRITFTIAQPPGIIFDGLTKWNNGKLSNDKVVTTLEQTPFSKIKQELVIGDSIFKIDWQLKRENDSSTLVIARVSDKEHFFKQNLQVPFYQNTFVKQSISAVENFYKTLIYNRRNYKLSEVISSKIPPKYCAYIALKSKTDDKASVMVKNIPKIMHYIKDNGITLDGDPFTEITKWDIEKDSIEFNFCFPIKKGKTYPETQQVFFKQIKERAALQTTFNGNYKISHMAWYKILHFAEINNINLEKLPMEFFLNDPHAGGNDLEWVAKIYVPIKN